MEHFYTLQGEGFWSGNAAYFIRLAGCDVGCPWCDVKESWTISEDQYVSIDTLLGYVIKAGADRVVITGGEPVMHNLDELTSALQEAGIKTHIETSGAHPFSGTFDWITLSPKKFKKPLPEYYQMAHELKVIIYNRHDFKWAEEEATKCDPEQTLLLLQPEWSRIDRVQTVIDYVKSNPKWKLSLQTHKYVNIP